MSLLDIELPQLALALDLAASEFFDRCEAIATSRSWRIDRRRNYAGDGYDQLNLHLQPGDPGYPMLRMVATPRSPKRLNLDVVASWSSYPTGYDEYLTVAHSSYRQLFDAYHAAYGKRLRLGVPRRPPALDMKAVDCNRIRYAAEKFSGLAQSFAVGEGDARSRLVSSFATWHVIRPDELPQPVRDHLKWVYDQVTRRPARTRSSQMGVRSGNASPRPLPR
jgi:hypothetical protein